VKAQGRAQETSPSALEKRLSMYWQMEAMNVALVPAAVLICAISLGDQIRWPLLVCLAANAVLLVIGACYWRIEYLRLRGQQEPYDTWLPRLAAAEPAAVVSTGLALISCVVDVLSMGGVSGATSWLTAGMALLALLEYVNYYRWQLQYFDHLPDFRALVKRRRLKRAHMARAIKRLRSRQQNQS
jgi:putative effector of murein hydrolase LrgA (UPF0299 family)